MVNFLNLSDTLYGRVGDNSGAVTTVFRRAFADVGRGHPHRQSLLLCSSRIALALKQGETAGNYRYAPSSP
jgi:hypothetical protein